MQVLSANPKQNTIPDGMVDFAVRSSQLASKLQDIACLLGISESDAQGLAEDGHINAIPLRSGDWLFPPIDKLVLWGEAKCNTPSPPEMQTQVISFHDNSSMKSDYRYKSVAELPKAKVTQPSLENEAQQLRQQLSVATNNEKLNFKKLITIVEACDFNHTSKLFAASRKRTPLVIANIGFKGLKLEGSEYGRKLIVKTKAIRCVLHEWTNLDDIQPSLLEKHIERYEHVFTQLNRRPETQEYKLYSQQLKTMSDVIYNHLHFNVFDKHGEGSDEHKLIESLIRNHLSKDVEVTLPSKRKEVINLMDEQFCSFTVARFNAYLKTFRAKNGVHDKIISRVKAAFNLAFNEKLISATDARPFFVARRIDRERHVEISGEHMQRMFEYLDDHVCPDFVFFIKLQSTGHFRRGQVMKLKFSDFDFDNNFVRVKPKRGKEVTIHLPIDVVNLVAKRKDQFKARGSQENYIFPSKQSKTGHRANFDDYWYEMLEELGFYTNTGDGKKEYQYRLHDFRETLLGRLQEFDDYTLASVLGHLSLHAVKHYKKANMASSKLAAEKGYERKLLVNELKRKNPL
ncbi:MULTISPECIES: site-specific integrase [unclassified Pseudoalteromonas]|uniref:tyrosine-type recombinase/integrase n=1 Tax=unclassified Pseudoalteromonas TaxID=194690 RepID=UPI0005A7A5F9|nr:MULTISPECIES: site-specific integrase [unclassified Pseudoalteromonas]